ncbi:MAG: type II toxin-antitoxin system VapC family toxin [bacterium]
MANTYLLDSNILVYAINSQSVYHDKALKILKQAMHGKINCCITLQNIYETYAVITDKKRIERPLSSAAAVKVLETNFLNNTGLKIIYQGTDLLPLLLNMLKKYKIKCQGIFDIVLVATMIGNNIKGIITMDTKRFNKFKFLKVLSL